MNVIYQTPKWPTGETFYLEMVNQGDGTMLGPFMADYWYRDLDGTWWGTPAEGMKPIGLRIRSQELYDGKLIIHANDGDMGDMDYLVWTRQDWDRERPGEDWVEAGE